MKIKPEHYQYMLDAIKPLAPQVEGLRAAIIAEGKAKDVEKRLRWDLHYKAGLTRWICENVYPYANDVHLDTALRKIVASLQ